MSLKHRLRATVAGVAAVAVVVGGLGTAGGAAAAPAAKAASNAPVHNCTFKTYNKGRYLTAVGGGGRTTDVLHTDAVQARSWEKFTLVDSGDGSSTIRYGIQTKTGNYLTAVGGGGRVTDVMHSDATQLRKLGEADADLAGRRHLRDPNDRQATTSPPSAAAAASATRSTPTRRASARGRSSRSPATSRQPSRLDGSRARTPGTRRVHAVVSTSAGIRIHAPTYSSGVRIEDRRDADDSGDERVDVVAAGEAREDAGEQPALARARQALLGEPGAGAAQRVVVAGDRRVWCGCGRHRVLGSPGCPGVRLHTRSIAPAGPDVTGGYPVPVP